MAVESLKACRLFFIKAFEILVAFTANLLLPTLKYFEVHLIYFQCRFLPQEQIGHLSAELYRFGCQIDFSAEMTSLKFYFNILTVTIDGTLTEHCSFD